MRHSPPPPKAIACPLRSPLPVPRGRAREGARATPHPLPLLLHRRDRQVIRKPRTERPRVNLLPLPLHRRPQDVVLVLARVQERIRPPLPPAQDELHHPILRIPLLHLVVNHVPKTLLR